MISQFLTNLWADIVAWAVVILTLAAVAGFIVSFFANLIPFPWIKANAKALHVLAIAAAIAAANIQGRASSSAHHRLKQAQEQVQRLERINARWALVAEIEQRKARENEKTMIWLTDQLMTAEAAAATARAEIADLEKTDEEVADFLRKPVPPPLRRVLVGPKGAASRGRP